MELIQLRALAMIDEAGTFTAAAERLQISQPALSQQIKALEREMGALLFERRGRQITWTAVGELTLARARQILGQLDQLHGEVADLLTLQRGQLRIGTSDTICLYLLPPIIQQYRQLYPQIEIHLSNRPSQEVVTLLQAGAIDFGIVTLPVQAQGVETSYLCDRQDVAVCAPEHPLARRAADDNALTVTELMTHQLLLLERGTTSRAFLDQLFVQAGVTPQAMELGSIEVLKRYAAINLGVAIVPSMSIKEEVAAGQLVPFALPWAPPRAIGVVQRRAGYQPPAAAAFLALLQARFA
jgi:DNA-binding transcriptional LysR family regulator